MNSDLTSLSDLFNNSIYRIPDYQRGYAWEDAQLNDFWEDLLNIEGDRRHYTGMLSLKLLKEEDYIKWDNEEKWLISSGYKPYHVVDGQQRLTTCIILISSILRCAKKHDIIFLNKKSLNKYKEKYIAETDEVDGVYKAFKFGYEIDNPSFEYFKVAILEEKKSGDLEETFYTLKLKAAKDFFEAHLEELFKEQGSEGLEILLQKVTTKLQFNTHYIDDDFDVFVAFETMNNRGKQLSKLEILKNRLIYLTTIFPTKELSKDKQVHLRKEINDAWKEVYKELGRNSKHPLNDDEFLRNHWVLFFTYSRNTGDDYIIDLLNRRFNQKAVLGKRRTVEYKESNEIDEDTTNNSSLVSFDDEKLTPQEILKYVNSLKEVSKYWYYSFNPYEDKELTSDEKKWIDKLNRIGINYFRTLVVATMMNGASTTDKVELYKSIEKFIFLCFRMARYQASYSSSKYYKLSKELLDGDKDIHLIIKELNYDFERNINEATKTFFSKTLSLFENKNGYYDWYDLRYFLFEYECSLAEQYSNVKIRDWTSFIGGEKDKISIEHIFPQTPTKWYWRNLYRQYNEVEQHRLCGSLGNLLPLEQKINSQLQNVEFEQKKNPRNNLRRGYSKGSNAEIEVSQKEDWSANEILDRGLHLLKFMEDRWGFKFPDEIDKYALLGIDFLRKQREYIPELPKDDIEDRDFDSIGNDDIKLTDYMKDKSYEMQDLYSQLYRKVKKEIPELIEWPTTVYISFRKGREGTNFAEVRLQRSQLKISIRKPINPENLIGESLPDSYTWSTNYIVKCKRPSDLDGVVKAIVDSAYQVN